MSYQEQMLKLIDKYRDAGQKWPAESAEIATWAIHKKLYAPHPEDIIKQCADHLSRAMRSEHLTDPQGRRVRAKHAATYHEGDKQHVLWDDIRTAEHDHMILALQQRRQQILGDCKQLKIDVDSYNENRKPKDPIQMVFDFTLDLEEAELIRRKVA